MIRLAYPWMLLLLLLVPALVFVRHRRRRTPSVQFSSGRVLESLPTSWAVAMQWILPACFTLALIFLVVAMARPQKGMQDSIVRTEAVDIVLLLDISTSMEAIDVSNVNRELNRLESAKQVVEKFVGNRPNDRIGMVAFAALPYTVAPLTLDHGWLVERMQSLRTGMVEDGTAIGTALASAINRLRDSEAKSKVIVLLTDGENNAGSLTPRNAAQAAQALDIRVYTVGAGSKGEALMPQIMPFQGKVMRPVRSRIDEDTLRFIAETTGGEYFRATDLKSLHDIYNQIDDLEKTEIEVEQFTRHEERFMPLVFLSICFLGLEKLLALTRLGRLP